MFDSPHVQPLSRSSLVFPLVLDPQLHSNKIKSHSSQILYKYKAKFTTVVITKRDNTTHIKTMTLCASIEMAIALRFIIITLAGSGNSMAIHAVCGCLCNIRVLWLN